jgi:uncharacterized membrane protein SpoIIM required for sporulation
LPAKQIEDFEQMYGKVRRAWDARATRETMQRCSAFYIRNNVQSASKLSQAAFCFGIGAAFYLLYNGLFAGAAMGHLVDAE